MAIFHRCQIGLLHLVDDSWIITLDELKKEISDTKYLNDIVKDEYGHVEGFERLLHKEYNLIDYADRRKATNLVHFDYCPCCGKKIDWSSIRKEASE